MQILSHGKLPHGHQLFQLDPVLQEGVLRVGGRLKNASLPHDLKHPVILLRDGVVTNLIVGYCHEKTQHQCRGQRPTNVSILEHLIHKLVVLVENN